MLDTYIYYTTLILSLVFIWSSFDRNQPFYLLHKKVAVFLTFDLLVELVAHGMMLYKLKNLFIYNGLVSLQLMFFCWLFYSELKKKWVINVAKWFLRVFPLIIVYNSFFFQNYVDIFQSNTYLLGSLFLVFLSINYFHDVFTDESFLDVNLLKLPFFWMATGLLFYFSATFTWGAFNNFMVEYDYVLAGTLSRIPTILGSLMFILFAIGFSCHKLFRT